MEAQGLNTAQDKRRAKRIIGVWKRKKRPRRNENLASDGPQHTTSYENYATAGPVPKQGACAAYATKERLHEDQSYEIDSSGPHPSKGEQNGKAMRNIPFSGPARAVNKKKSYENYESDPWALKESAEEKTKKNYAF